jgi:cyclophilin family peptidyl-prolyl cis-trans isomerase
MSKAAPHQNGSVFYITLNPLPHFDRQYVAFGRVVEGLGVLRAINEQESYYQRPVPEIYIEDCGLMNDVAVSRIETP